MKFSGKRLPLLVLGLVLILQISPSVQQSIDEVIAGASSDPSSFDLIFDISGNNYLVELDMLFTKEQYDAYQAVNENDDPNSPNLSRKKRKAIKALNYRWKSKTIPYKVARGVFSSADMRQINMAIQEWQTHTCIRFREASSSDNNRIYFNNGRGCYSYVGMTGGSQTVGLARGCRYKGVVVHEIGHAVGFHHEQNRPDRDNYVRIVRSNIPSNLYYNFKKYPWSAVTTHNVPYDYGSVMHYGGTAFSRNGQYTIRTVNPKDQDKIGNRKGLSFNDIKLANIMYSCNERCSNIKCPGAGFLNKDCKCMCPGNPIRECTGSEVTTKQPVTRPTSRPVTTERPTCKDMNKYCSAWAQSGYCGRNSYVKTYCKQSCKLCSGSSTGQGDCKDLREHCNIWKSRGYCVGKFETFMGENCAKTCKKCIPRLEEQSDSGASLQYTATVVVSSLLLFFSSSFLSLAETSS